MSGGRSICNGFLGRIHDEGEDDSRSVPRDVPRDVPIFERAVRKWLRRPSRDVRSNVDEILRDISSDDDEEVGGVRDERVVVDMHGVPDDVIDPDLRDFFDEDVGGGEQVYPNERQTTFERRNGAGKIVQGVRKAPDLDVMTEL